MIKIPSGFVADEDIMHFDCSCRKKLARREIIEKEREREREREH